jgi:PPOX class probable F420-dependent enzyme
MAPSDALVVDPALLEQAREFLGSDLRFATIATIGSDGAPHQAVVWFLFQADVLVMNSAVGRAWPANLARDRRTSVTVEDGYRWLSIRGMVEADDDPARAQADIAAMARRYHADEPDRAERMIRDRFERQHRISFHLPLASSRLHFEE